MNKPGLVDSHIHLTDYEPGTDLSAIIERSRAAGVTHLVCNATSELDWRDVLDLARVNAGVVPCLGLHPWFVHRRSSNWLSILEEMVASTGCGVGEAGLDKCVEPLDRASQEEAFRAQLDLARRYDRPITVHCVRSWGWLTDVLRTANPLPRRLLLHAYGGSEDLIRPLSEMGAYFSFSGKVLDVNYVRARISILAVPRDRLLVETDGPNMLPPEPYCTEVVTTADGRAHNHPANLPAIVDGIAELLGESTDTLLKQIWENARSFHGSALDEE